MTLNLLRHAACVLLAAAGALVAIAAHAQGPLDRIPPDGPSWRIELTSPVWPEAKP